MDLLSVFLAVCCLCRLVCSAVPRAFAVGQGYMMLTSEVLCAVPWLVLLRVKILFVHRQEDSSQIRGVLMSFREQVHKLNKDGSNIQAAVTGNAFP